MKSGSKTEQEMRAEKAPTPDTLEALVEYITSLVDRKHDYGTCVYAMSLAATAAFQHVAHKLGVTGFQASCADLDIVRRTRSMEGPFILLKGEDMLYPQYDLPGKLREAIGEWADWAAEQATKKLAENKQYDVHPNVWAHWVTLAAHKSNAQKVREDQRRDADTPPPACWAVIAYRWGWINGHQYIVRVTNDLQAAKDAADAEAMHRGGKYGVTVWGSDGAQVYHSPSSYREAAAHVNYRKEMFEAVGLHVVVGLEEGKPLTADDIATRWRQEVQMQWIMERADQNQPNNGLTVSPDAKREANTSGGIGSP